MSFINITTNNLSKELKNSATFIDNWAYVPGTSITGDWKTLYAFTSLQDFKDTCGTQSPEGSITYEYVAGLLSSGIPVLFRRIACVGQDSDAETVGVTAASVTLTHTDSETGSTISDLKISEKYGGTFGNNLNVTIRDTGVAYWVDVYNKYTLLERKKIIKITAGESLLEINQAFIDAIESTSFDRITIEVLEEDPSIFNIQAQLGVSQTLSGGTDFDESLVAAEIPNSYSFIKDKILYQPKFLTSGGYTDADPSTAAPIADAMIALSLSRQDCRALIDLPIGTPAEDQQALASNFAYQQLSEDEAIPSASMCAPWQYMQVGTSQLWMPPSYVYLTVMGNSLSKGGTCYTPKAGIATGQVSNIIKPEFQIGSDLSEQWQSDTTVNINPIMQLQTGSYVIAGNSTLLIPEGNEEETNAFFESSVDLTVIEIRRYIYRLGLQLQYQYNSADAFDKFSTAASKFLDTMESEGAITDYEIYNMSTSADPRTLKIKLNVWVTPTIKNIEINLNVAYGSIEVSSGGEA